MAYSDFTTTQKAAKELQLTIFEEWGIFANVEQVNTSSLFLETLDENVPLAQLINTEKARSELIITPVLVELRKVFNREISFFSGVEFDVDRTKGLNGRCDFLISQSPQQLFPKSPIVAMVEGKNASTMEGLGQCLAEMVAAQIFNNREGRSIETIYGVVTTGVYWKFMKLQGNDVHIDMTDYAIGTPKQIISILVAMVRQKI